ncbi:MAG TPA: hypothetical protein VM165_05695, partial [Planctomycetaceae bacterium]|nr:hypothetical protein [Planctomycetaceae bacterium]
QQHGPGQGRATSFNDGSEGFRAKEAGSNHVRGGRNRTAAGDREAARFRPAATGGPSECPAKVPTEQGLPTVAQRGQAKAQTGICNQSASEALTSLVGVIVYNLPHFENLNSDDLAPNSHN